MVYTHVLIVFYYYAAILFVKLLLYVTALLEYLQY